MPEVDGLRLGLTVDLLMAMGEATALSLQRFHQTACQSSNADVSRGREAVFRGRFLWRCWIIFLVTRKKDSARKAGADVSAHPAAEKGWPGS